MGIGKEIKVVLALDDSGFSVKTKHAAEVVNALKTGLGELSKSTTVVETSVGDLTKNLKGFTDGFGALQKSLQNTVDQLQRAVTGGFNQMAKTTKEASKVAKDGAQAQIDAKIKTLENELETNRKLLESRGRLHAEMRKMESDQRAASTAAMMNAEKAERGKKAGAPAVITSNMNEADRLERNANAMRQQIMATEQWIAIERVAQTERIAEINSLERERKAVIESTAAKETLARVSAAVGKSNAAEIQRVAKLATAAQKESDMAAAKSAADLARLKKQYADQEVRDRAAAEQQIRREAQETAAAQRRAAQEATEEARRQNQQVAAMWKGMAQLYASSKIEQGMMGSITNSDDYSRIVERLDAMGLDGAQGKINTLAIAKQMREQNPNMSSTDALKMTLATTAGAVSTDPKIIGQIAPEIAKMTTVMTRLFPEQAHNIEQYTQNMMGVMESRGIAKDPEKMLSTLDNLARALMLTQGKLSIQDYETIGRRGSNMQVKSDESILYDIAAASQLKVAGGGGGGGAGGVSTFATMQKQAAKGAEGGILEKRSALENQVEFGIVDRSELMAANGNKPLGRNAKAVAYVGADQASENMVKFGIDLVNKVKAKLAALPENDTRFFKKGADRTSDMAQTSAFNRFADQTFGNTSRAGFYKLLSSQGSQERIGSEVEAAKQAPGYSKDHEAAMKSWGVAVDKTKSSLTDLGIVIGNVLIPILQPCLEWITKLIDGVKSFGEDNPMAAALTTIAAGFGGLVLGVQGFMSMMGGSGLLGMLGAFLGIAPQVGGAASFAGGLIRGLGSAFKVLAAVLLAWDIGKIIGTWLDGVKVGTLTIGDYVSNLITKIEVGWKRLMLSSEENALKLRNFFHIDNDEETKKGLASVQIRREFLKSYEKIVTVTPSDRAAQDKAAAKAVTTKPAPGKAGKAGKGVTGYDPSEDALNADTSTADTSGMFQTAHKTKKDRDPLSAALENTKGEVAAQKEKLDSIVLGAETVDSLRRQAAELIEGKRKADEFSPNHDKDQRPAANDAKITSLKEETFQKMLLAEQTKAVEFANQRMASRAVEADTAIERMTEGGVAKQTDAFRALVREMAAAEQRIGAGAGAFGKWNKAKNEALFQQAAADGANFAAGYGDKNKAEAAKLLLTEKERIAAELKAARDKEDSLFNMHMDTIAKTRAADLATATTAKEKASIEARFAQVRDGVEAAYSERRKIRAEEEARAMESATTKMTRDWKDVGKAVDDIGASAANSFVSMLTGSLSSGRLAVGDFIKGVLTDLANAKLKETLADPLKDVVNAGGNWVKQNVFGMAGGGDAASSLTAASRATADTTAAAAATTLATTMTTMMMPAVMDLSYAMQAAAANSMGGMGGGGGFLGGIGSFFGSSGGGEAASEGSAEAVSNFLFADGGIMTSMGPMELRKYANGGVANSPQVAIYGEAGPEAYVPLPDGRSIPVTMTGGQQQGAAPNVQVNVINQTSQPVNAQQGGVRFDGKQFILDVVMTAASSPGPFRQNMKDAMK